MEDFRGWRVVVRGFCVWESWFEVDYLFGFV